MRGGSSRDPRADRVSWRRAPARGADRGNEQRDVLRLRAIGCVTFEQRPPPQLRRRPVERGHAIRAAADEEPDGRGTLGAMLFEEMDEREERPAVRLALVL